MAGALVKPKAALLQQFTNITQLPSRLPPPRGHLKEGTSLINVRPFRYLQAQKDEIERLVGEMLAAGIIRPSNNSFSSSVLLVRKKDGNWRLCVDHRALNRATVPDKFPIPMRRKFSP